VNIGVIPYSQISNALSVAETLRDKMVASGHGVALARDQVYNPPTTEP